MILITIPMEAKAPSTDGAAKAGSPNVMDVGDVARVGHVVDVWHGRKAGLRDEFRQDGQVGLGDVAEVGNAGEVVNAGDVGEVAKAGEVKDVGEVGGLGWGKSLRWEKWEK